MTVTLNKLTIESALEGLENKEFSSEELTKAHIDIIEQKKHLNAYITETYDIALEQAKKSDERRSKGEAGKLDGIPLGIKDVYCTKNIRTTAGSKILENFVPTYESTVSQKLLNEGSVFLGKLNLDQFAMGTGNLNSYFGPVENPWRRKTDPETKLIPGGSSGGSSASVAADIAMAATGTDTGGSCRQPAACCGVVGFKPTYGRCSRWGIIAFASSLDQAGLLTKSVGDCALLTEIISGFDPKDSTSANLDVPSFTGALEGDVKGLRIGIPSDYRIDNMDPAITKYWDKTAQQLKEMGAEIVDVSLPNTRYALPAYYIIAPAEASSNLARYDGVRYGTREDGENLIDMYERSRAEGFGDEVKRRIMIGTYALSSGYYDAYYIKAQKVRALVAKGFEDAFEKCDVMLTPTAPTAAFGFNENTDDPIQMYLQDIFTIPTSMAGLPGLSLPVGLNDENLPIGLQVIGKKWDEETVFKVSRKIEEAVNFTAKPQSIQKEAA